MNIYTTSGTLTNPVNDLGLAQQYLSESDMTQYIDDRLTGVVLDIRWELTSVASWKVTVVAQRELTDDEEAAISSWISGQNSDGLGEGFEQQAFAEEDDEDDEYSVVMSSFDWQTNGCKLTLVK